MLNDLTTGIRNALASVRSQRIKAHATINDSLHRISSTVASEGDSEDLRLHAEALRDLARVVETRADEVAKCESDSNKEHRVLPFDPTPYLRLPRPEGWAEEPAPQATTPEEAADEDEDEDSYW